MVNTASKLLASLQKKLHLSVGHERTLLLICMGISFILWVFVKLSKAYEADGIIYLEYRTPPGTKFVETPPATLTAHLAGSGWRLLTHSLRRQQATVQFDLSDQLRQELTRQEIIRKIESRIPLEVRNIDRNSLVLHLDTIAFKKVPITLDQAFTYQSDYYVRDSIRLQPDSVTAYGPPALLAQLTEIKTARLEMVLPESDVYRTLPLLNPLPDLLTLSGQETEVFIPVEQFTEKTFIVPIRVANASDSVRLLPSSVQLKCVAGVTRYSNLDAGEFVVEADFENVLRQPDQLTVPLKLVRSPAGLRAVYFSPQSVEFLIIE